MKDSLIKLTIISESLLREEIVTLVRRHGATGFTLSKVEGQGSRGVRASEWEGRNLKFEVIVSSATADAILDEITEKYFEDFAVIAWLTEVEVLRGHKFIAAE
jgi:nitrogen regulatory protein PII